MIALLLGNWRLIGWTLAVLAILASASVAIGKYNDRIRAPLQAEIRLLQAEKKAIEDRSDRMVKERDAEIAQLKEKNHKDAIQRELSYQEKFASLRAAGSSGLRLYKGCSGSTAGQTGTGSPGTPAKPAAESRTGDEARGVIFGPEEIGKVLQWYAYGQSCHAFVNGK